MSLAIAVISLIMPRPSVPVDYRGDEGHQPDDDKEMSLKHSNAVVPVGSPVLCLLEFRSQISRAPKTLPLERAYYARRFGSC